MPGKHGEKNDMATASAEMGTDGGTPITGWTVLKWLIGFFGVMVIANAFFVWFALTSFPGLETESAYESGRAYPEELAAAAAQAERGWQVDVETGRAANGGTAIAILPRDRAGAPLTGLTGTVALHNLRGAEFDRAAPLIEAESGRYTAGFEALPRGNWTVTIDLMRGDERLWRSRSKIVLE